MKRLNSCHNRRSFATTQRVQDGWIDSGPSRVALMKEIPFRMTPGCVYGNDTSEDARRGGLGAFDPGCAGCSWKRTDA